MMPKTLMRLSKTNLRSTVTILRHLQINASKTVFTTLYFTSKELRWCP